MSPAFRLVDILCELFPDKREAITKAATQYYENREQKMGEALVESGVITEEQLKLGLITQKAEMGRLSKSDEIELDHIRSSIHTRFMASCEEMSLISGALPPGRTIR